MARKEPDAVEELGDEELLEEEQPTAAEGFEEPLNPEDIQLEDDEPEDPEDEVKLLANCARCGNPIYDRPGLGDADPYEIGPDKQYRHANCSKARILHDKARTRDRRRYQRSAVAKQRAATAREA